MFQSVSSVVAGSGAGLMEASVVGPGQDVGEGPGEGAGQVCQETADLGWREADQPAGAFGEYVAVTAK